MNPQINNKSSSKDGLTADIYKHFSNELAPVLQMFMTPGESLATWVLLLEQESYLPNIKNGIQKILQITDHYTKTFQSQLQKTLDKIIGETSQLLFKKSSFQYLWHSR